MSLASAAATCRRILPIYKQAVPKMAELFPRSNFGVIEDVICAAECLVAEGKTCMPVNHDIISAIPIYADRVGEPRAKQVVLAVMRLHEAATYFADKPDKLAEWCSKVEEHARAAENN